MGHVTETEMALILLRIDNYLRANSDADDSCPITDEGDRAPRFGDLRLLAEFLRARVGSPSD